MFSFEGSPLLARCVRVAAGNLLEINTVPGRSPQEPARFVRAGGGYAEPWTRDAAINAWLAASWLAPDVAGDTLRMVCEPGEGGDVVAQDDQWWDQVIWVIAAHRHFLLTGDAGFLRWAEGVARRSLAIAEDRFVPEAGLFRGPAVMADGISAYPAELVEPGNESSFVLDHPRTHEVFALSTNLVHAGAFAALGRMARALGEDGGADLARAEELLATVDRRFRLLSDDGAPAAGHGYGYLLIPGDDGGLRLDPSQETLGLAMALLGGLLRGEAAERLVAGLHREPQGVVAVWPHLQGYSDEYPGRHNVIVWPWITGLWTQAVAATGDAEAFGAELDALLALTQAGDLAYPEVQHPVTGAPDGGWQTDAGWADGSQGEYVPGIGRHWASEPDQTWSATALLGVVTGGLLGLCPHADGLRLAPLVPAGTGDLRVTGLRYGGVVLDVSVTGHGSTLVSLEVDGVPVALDGVHVPAALRDESPRGGEPRTVRVTAVVS